MPDEKDIKLQCPRCGKTMSSNKFFKYRGGGFYKLCKACLTAHVDNFNPDTFLWILKEFDVPYSEVRWNELRDRAFRKNPQKMNGLSVIGRYLGDMRLNQWANMTWADTERINQVAEEQKEHREEQQKELEKTVEEKYQKGEISEAEYKTFMSVETLDANYDYEAPPKEVKQYAETQKLKEKIKNISDEISDDDKMGLMVKWGTEYNVAELLQLERKYNEMCACFDIRDSDTIGSLILICKTYLKMNQAVDANDIETYQKLSRVYESMRKSSKFTAAQKDDKEMNSFNSVGQLVAFCEKEGGAIPKWDLSIPLDDLDKVIIDMKKYTRDLIYEDTALSRQIEAYLKKREAIEEAEKQEEEESRTLDEKHLTDAEIASRLEDIALEKEIDRGDSFVS